MDLNNNKRKKQSFLLQANRAQLNHKAFFGGEDDEFDIDNDEKNSLHLFQSQPNVQQTTITKTSLVVKSKSTDNIRTTATATTTIIENGKTKIVCPRDQKKVSNDYYYYYYDC